MELNRRCSRLLILKVFILIPIFGMTQSVKWEEMSSVEELVSAYPERVTFLFDHLDLEREGIGHIKKAYVEGNVVLACKLLLEHYKNSPIKDMIKQQSPRVSGRTVPLADSIMKDIITVQRVTDRIPRLDNGHLNWHHRGPENDAEYAWLFNRHSSVHTLLNAWQSTGNAKYARYIDKFIKDWIISSWPYPGVKSNTGMWRGLEVTARVRTWMPAFFNLNDTEYLSPATQLLILSSLPEHAHYLRNFHAQANWLTMEMNGLATFASSWPEFKTSPEWLVYAINAMTESMKDQVYPDGIQTELTSHYHHVALANFVAFNEICKRVNVQLPEYYTRTIEDMWNYLAVTIRPDGYGLLNNDSDENYNRDLIMRVASQYDRDDWKYIASNGQEGVMPQSGPSFFFPWAGQLISRSGYDANAHWSFFDIGPWGSGHQHNDKLHLSVVAYGQDLLVDGGRFAYTGEVARKFRRYSTGSHSHNLLLIDGKGQGPGPRVTDKPVPENEFVVRDDFDYASSTAEKFMDLEGNANHIRSLFYVRGKFWVVVDRVVTDRPRKVEALWHWHPDCTVEKGRGVIVSTTNPRGNLTIIPVGKTKWNVDFVKGQEEPTIQGWYSREYNAFVPNTTTIYSCEIGSDQTFVWILLPSEAGVPKVDARVLSQTADAVKVRVSLPGSGYWDVNVPYMNSAEAGFNHVARPGK
jgi:hypothetical protein